MQATSFWWGTASTCGSHSKAARPHHLVPQVTGLKQFSFFPAQAVISWKPCGTWKRALLTSHLSATGDLQCSLFATGLAKLV